MQGYWKHKYFSNIPCPYKVVKQISMFRSTNFYGELELYSKHFKAVLFENQKYIYIVNKILELYINISIYFLTWSLFTGTFKFL